MAELKTKPTKQSIEKFLDALPDEKKRADAYKILDMMKKITKMEPRMWGPTMIGFGTYHYKYASGHEGDSFLIGFSPRKPQMVLYGMPVKKYFPELAQKLGKFKSSVSCLYITKLDDVDISILKQLMAKSFKYMKDKYGKMK